MPTYEYECTKCGHAFEQFQSMKDEPLKKCPVCKGKVKRLLGTGAGILFKGSGFYQTDYRSSSYHSSVKAEKSAPAASSASSSSSSTAASSSASSAPPAATGGATGSAKGAGAKDRK